MKLPVLSCALAAGVFVFGGLECARALTLAEGLDTPGVVWSSSVRNTWRGEFSGTAHDGVDVVSVPDLTDLEDPESTPVLSTPIAGPAVVRFWWRYITAVTDPAIQVGVDGAFMQLPLRYPDDNGWIPVEVHVSSGVHVLGLRPFIGTAIEVDEVTITPGAGSLGQAAGQAGLSWVVPWGAKWKVSTDHPAGFTASAAWESGGGYPEAGCLAPPNSKIEGWYKFTQPGQFFAGSEGLWSYNPAGGPSPEWQHFRTVAATRWVTFRAQGTDGIGDLAVDLKLAGITVSPAGAGDYLDAPELTWTQSGAPPFALSTNEYGYRGTGSMEVSDTNPFSTGLQTTLTGPGRLFFSSNTYHSASDRWEVFLNGNKTMFHMNERGEWVRQSLTIPPGPVAAEFRAVNVRETDWDWGYFTLDYVTMCAAGTAEQKDALDLPASAPLWVRQTDTVPWSRTTAVSHDGTDALLLPASTAARRADLMLPTEGAPLAGLWIKTSPELFLTASAFAEGEKSETRFFRPAVSDDWMWLPIQTISQATELSLAVAAATDTGREVYLDNYTLYRTAVPAAEALDTPGRTWMGNPGLALPGSDAAGEKAVLLAEGASAWTTVHIPARVQFRYRFCGPTQFNEGNVSLTTVTYLDSTAAGATWQNGEFRAMGPGQDIPLMFHCSRGGMLLDTVVITPLVPATIPEALDAPAVNVAVANGWTGLTGFGHDNTDVVLSPPKPRAEGPFDQPAKSRLIVDVPAGASVDGAFWWMKENDMATSLEMENLYGTSLLGRVIYSGNGWQQMRFHRDRASTPVTWTQSVEWWRTPLNNIPAGHSLLDQLVLQPGAEYAFSKALDTHEAEGQALTGWDAAGDAAVTAQTAEFWQDGDALEIRATPGGAATQSALLFTRFGAGTDFSCRVKRGPVPGGTLTLYLDNEPFIEAAPLTADWTEFRALLPADFAAGDHWLALRVTVPDTGTGAAVYLDAVSLREATDLNFALDTTGLTWTGSGDGQQIISGQVLNFPDLLPPYTGVFDGVGVLGLAHGQRRRLETVMTGPGTVVLTGWRSPEDTGGWRTWLLVDGSIRDLRPGVEFGVFSLQAFVPAGAHTVRWMVERDDPLASPVLFPEGEIYLHSAALVPGLPADLLPAALESIAPGRTWVKGGTHPPVPLYALREGATALNGIFFPSSGPGETSWIETNISGPAHMKFTWQSPVVAACRMDGRTACRTMPELTGYYYSRPRDPYTTMEVPAGPHTFRWASAQGTPAELRAFSLAPGSDIAGLLAGSPEPIVWLQEPETYNYNSWRVITDDRMFTYDGEGHQIGLSGTGLPVLGGADMTTGSFWVTGPALVSWDVRRSNFAPLLIKVDQEAWYHGSRWPDGSSGLHWNPDGIVVPTGEHLVSFMINDDDGRVVPYIRLKNMRVSPGAAWLNWAYGIGLVTLPDSSPYSDPDNDGAINLMEFAFGTPPLSSAAAAAGPALTGPPEARRLQFPALPWDAGGLTYVVEMSTNMESWSPFATVAPNPPHQPGPSVALPALEGGGRVFFRVVVGL